MTISKPLQERIRELNDNARFQLVGRVAAIFGVPAILGMITWALILLVGMSQDVAVMKAQRAIATADPYKGADAKRDFALRDNMITVNAGAIKDLSERVKTLEYGAARR